MTGGRRGLNERGLDRHVVTVRVLNANVDEERMSTITKDEHNHEGSPRKVNINGRSTQYLYFTFSGRQRLEDTYVI